MAKMVIFLIFLVSLTTTVYSRPQPTSKSTVVDIPSGLDTRLLVVGLIGGVIEACLIYLVCFCVCILKRKVCHAHASDDELINIIIDGVKVMPFEDLKKATNNFSNILGKGGSGTVYKGDLEDGTKVAVKRTERRIKKDEFKTEIAVSTVVRHSHLVALRGYYFDAKERLLVYDYMPQGTLSRFLFDWERQGLNPLDWTQRLNIALDVARGLEYMHCLGQQCFIHRDLKPSNILLDNDMRAKVADFRLARPASDSSVTHRAGTFGYFAPEYAEMGTASIKIDVYSFGVILAELITGRRAIIAVDGEERVLLVKWLLRMYKDAVTFRQAVDPTLDLDEEEALDGVIMAVAELAAQCCASRPNKRPNMSQVVTVLSDLADPWKPSEAEGVEHYTDTDTGSSFSSLDGWSEPETEAEGVEHYTDADSGSFSSLDG